MGIASRLISTLGIVSWLVIASRLISMLGIVSWLVIASRLFSTLLQQRHRNCDLPVAADLSRVFPY
jgi:hypothetical protein